MPTIGSAVKEKRLNSGLSLRALSEVVGVSFSSLARIERGEGTPDNNTAVRLLNWLGSSGEEFGLETEKAAWVHFRASKSVASRTVELLLQVANNLRACYATDEGNDIFEKGDDPFESAEPISLSKDEMEKLTLSLRKSIGLKNDEALDALRLRISGVKRMASSDLTEIAKEDVDYLVGVGSRDWSAMSVPVVSSEVNWIILLNDSHSPVRQRVTYLEECWHIMQGHRLTRIQKVSGKFGRAYHSSEEGEAYYLAAATLLPKSAVERCAKGEVALTETARGYGVSTDLVEYRIKRLGLWHVYKSMDIDLH